MLSFGSPNLWEIAIYSFVVSAVLLFVAVKYIRPKFPVSVNCWFCNSNCYVPYHNKNSWNCPHCEQYNGFCQNGDYNKLIPAQYDEVLNSSNKCEVEDKSELDKIGNGLCEICNRNQLLKIKQLAAFVPQHEESFETEVDAYERHLDSVYKLCELCEDVLCQKLRQENLSLRGKIISWKLQQKKASSSPPKQQKLFQFFHEVPIYIKLLQLCSLTLIFLICIQSIHLLQVETRRQVFPLSRVVSQDMLTLLISGGDCNPLFSLFGFFVLITTILAAGKDRLRLVDALDCFVWLITLFIQLPFIAGLFPTKEDRLIIQGLLSFVGILFTLGCFVCKRPVVSYRRSWNGAELSTSSGSSNSDRSSCGESFLGSHPSVWQSGNVKSRAGVVEFRQQRELLQDHHISTTTLSSVSEKMPGAFNLDFSLGSHLQAMQISTPRKPQSVSGIFTRKTYSSSASPWMTPSHHGLPLHRSILSPARLQTKSISHSSWVAGGYWASAGSPLRCRSLCGSNSELYSGLRQRNGSVGKFTDAYPQSLNVSCSCPTSRTNSVCGDDKLSVFSEPARATSPSVTLMPQRGRNSYFTDPFSPIRDMSLESSTSSSSNCSNSSIISRKSLVDIPERTVCMSDNQFQQPLQDGWKLPLLLKILIGFSLLSNAALVTFFISTYAR